MCGLESELRCLDAVVIPDCEILDRDGFVGCCSQGGEDSWDGDGGEMHLECWFGNEGVLAELT